MPPQWMAAKGYGSNYTLLESYYEQRLLDLIAGLGKGYIVWQVRRTATPESPHSPHHRHVPGIARHCRRRSSITG